MDARLTKPEPARRWRRLASVVWCGVAVVLSGLLIVDIWLFRVGIVTHMARMTLDRYGFSDTEFAIAGFDTRGVVLEDIRIGQPQPLLEVDQMRLRFRVGDLLRGRLERLDVEGVRLDMRLDEQRITLPLAELLLPRLATIRRPDRKSARIFQLDAATVREMRIDLLNRKEVPLTQLVLELSAFAEPHGCTRVWGSLGDAATNLCVRVDGTLEPGTGNLSLRSDMRVATLAPVADWIMQATAGEGRRHRIPVRIEGGLTARGEVTAERWREMRTGNMEVALDRQTVIRFEGEDRFVRFQNLRADLTGAPDEWSLRLHAGVSGFRLDAERAVARESGRLLSLRGNARLQRTGRRQHVTATLESDLPGRSLGQLFSAMLPLVPRLFAEGGTLRVETDLTAEQGGKWTGQTEFLATAKHSSVRVPAGRAGAESVSVSATVPMEKGKAGALQARVAVEDGFVFKKGFVLRGGAEMRLTAAPPYDTANGTLTGRIAEMRALRKRGVSMSQEGVGFESAVQVSGLVTNPVWHLDLHMPETAVAVTNPVCHASAMMGAQARVQYGAQVLAAEGGVWVRDGAARLTVSGGVQNVVAGLERAALRFDLPAYAVSAPDQAVADVSVEVTNGWLRADDRLALEGLQMFVPLRGSVRDGITCLAGQRFGWDHWEAEGVRLVADGFGVEADTGQIAGRLGVRAVDSAARVDIGVVVPIARPGQAKATVTFPEASLERDDALAARLRKAVPDLEASARVAAEAAFRLGGGTPHAVGRVCVRDGQFRKKEMSVSGLALDMPFEFSPTFRTIERPSLTFKQIQAGNIRLDAGRIEFDLTPREVSVGSMEVGWCKGSLRAYSVLFDLKDRKDEFIVYADRIDLGEALMMVMPFQGVMEGVLYGRFPVGIDGNRIRLSTGYLYSLPGQGGRLKLDDAAPMASLLDRAGIKGDVQRPLSKALSDLLFHAIRLELEPKPEGDAVLRILLEGKSNDKDWPAPVSLNLNLHGPIEKLVNVGLDLSRE
ncbi:MAG TPA: YdbH domain-containing protein [Kiritimatiellia bacterium]|nr:YdbH domain-containing protein [Kiritimatiellia bacterium]HOR96838.1 YdbH domain-containing protein [Kiritimatiellia bacterium]HPC48770.1 YdbH domain-containing protein [Kiritimatiellia bacterium]HPK37479.1 YdbH domain-containing protein [Kiritimatiellia bacterium]